MNRKEYLELKATILADAQKLIDERKIEEAKAKREEIEKLDKEFEAAVKEQANLDALNEENNEVDIKKSAVTEGGLNPVDKITEKMNELSYEEVFSKVALQRDLNENEIAVFNQMNPQNVYTHTTYWKLSL